MLTYKTSGVCAREIKFEVEDGKITSVDFVGGCPGNLIGLSSLVEGMDVQEAIDRLSDIRCGNKKTSCPDQFSKALKSFMDSSAESA